MQIKGKGMMVTYWLLGEDKDAKHVEVIEISEDKSSQDEQFVPRN